MPSSTTALSIEELPLPPQGKIGWPWTEPIQPLPERMSDGSEWPRISIVTPSYNYGRFIEETIRSVLLQGYPNLEYIIIDGGSTDNTVEIIQKYEKYLTYWVSEPDAGQTDAINKGYQHCTGDIFVWLNADDSYINSTCLSNIATIYRSGYEFIVGEFLPVDEDGNELSAYKQYGKSTPVNFYQCLKFWAYGVLPQPAVFIATTITDKCFPLDSDLEVVMDFQFFIRALSQNPRAIWVNQIWVKFKYHGNNKSLGNINKNQEFDGFLEIYNVALSESDKLPIVLRMLFQTELKDYKAIHSLISSNKPPTTSKVMSFLLSRPTLGRWLLFWKIFLKSLLGTKLYSVLKETVFLKAPIN